MSDYSSAEEREDSDREPDIVPETNETPFNQNSSHQSDDERNDAEQNDDDADNKQPAEKKVKVVHRPQPKLHEHLKGPRGLSALGSVFQNVTFKGRGHEEQDLNVLMKRYEYWCHRMFPKFPFDTCLKRLERLGEKKETKVLIKRMRMNETYDAENEEETQNTVSNVQTEEIVDEPPSSPEVELTEEQMERIRINRERAAEKLRLLKERQMKNAENVVDEIFENENVTVLE